MPSSATLLPCAGLEAGRPDVDNFSTLDFFDPRGRANRKGLAVFAAVLIGAQAGVYGTMLATSFDPMSGPAWVFHFLFCWLGFVAIAKRLHDIGYGSRRLILAAIAMAVWTIVLALATAYSFGEAALVPGGLGTMIAGGGTLIPGLAATFWLHFKRGDEGANYYGAAPGPLGFTRPPQRSRRQINEGVAKLAVSHT